MDWVNTAYYYLNGKLLGEKRGSTNIQYVYDSSGIAGMVYGGYDYVFRKDIQGNVVAIYRGNTLMAQYEYDAWGRCMIVSDSSGIGTLNPFRYRGYYYDSETGLYYLRTRYYDPETGRFLSPDTVDNLAPEEIGGLNLFAYCLNNPVMGVDPNGTSALLIAIIAGAISGVIVGGFYGGMTAAANEDNVGVGILLGAGAGLLMGIGAAIGGYILAPVLAGTSTVFGLSVGASVAIGTVIPFATGAIVGGAADAISQYVNEGMVDLYEVGISALQWGVINVAAAYLSALLCDAPLAHTTAINTPLNLMTGAFGLLFDVLRNRL